MTIDDLKKLERHLNEVQVANFEGNASMAQMVMAQHEALIRILDYLIGYATKEKLTSIMQDAAKPVSDTCTQILGEIEKIKAVAQSGATDNETWISARRAGMIEMARWVRDRMPTGLSTIADALERLESGGDL